MQEPNRSPQDDAAPDGAGPDAMDTRAAPEAPPVYEVQELPIERRLVQDRRGRGARKLAVVEGAAPGATPVTERRSGERKDRRR